MITYRLENARQQELARVVVAVELEGPASCLTTHDTEAIERHDAIALSPARRHAITLEELCGVARDLEEVHGSSPEYSAPAWER